MATIGLVISDGGASAVLDLTAGAVLFTAPVSTPFNSRSGVDRFPTGLFAFGNNGSGTGPLTIWQWTGAAKFATIATVAAPAVAITSNSLANPTVITCAAPHFLVSTQTATIAGVTGSVPPINGAQVVTVLSPTTFSIAVNVTNAGVGGTVTAANAGLWQALSANGANLWATDTTGGATTPVFRKLDQTGAVLKTVGPITALANGVRAMTPALDESVMYYSAGLTAAPIKRWNLVTNVAGADLVTPADPVIGMWPIPASTDIAVVTETGGSAPTNTKIIRYTTAGAVVYTKDFYDLPAGAQDTTIELARDPSLTSIWVRMAAAPAYLQSTASVYMNVDLLAGGILSSVIIPATPPIGYFSGSYGVPPVGTMYPFVILGTSCAPAGSLT